MATRVLLALDSSGALNKDGQDEQNGGLRNLRAVESG